MKSSIEFSGSPQTSLMSLKYEQIQRWRPEKNGYVFKDSEIRNGTNLSDII